MNYIIFDLEWNQPYPNDISFLQRAKMPISGEIIQIGAVKLDDDLEVVDTFNILIKPQYLKKMHKKVEKLTGISSQDLQKGVSFPKAFSRFLKWCGPQSVWLSWGADDMLQLRENLMLHGLHKESLPPWYDAQIIYAREINGDTHQVSVQKALISLHIDENIYEDRAHNAWYDAMFTAHICRKIHLKKGIEACKSLHQARSLPLMYPKPLSFFVYKQFRDKRSVWREYRVRSGRCPFCQQALQVPPAERIGGDRFISIGTCSTHGDFALHWKVGKYTDSRMGPAVYVVKMISHSNSDLLDLYQEKKRVNEEKRQRYLERMQKKQVHGV